MKPHFPHITVPLTGEDGNALMVIGRVIRAMRAHGISEVDIAAFREEAMSGDYDHVLQTVMATVDVT